MYNDFLLFASSAAEESEIPPYRYQLRLDSTEFQSIYHPSVIRMGQVW